MLYNCKHILDRVKEGAKEYIKTLDFKPEVVIIQAGNDEPSNRYVRNKVKDFEYIGITGTVKHVDTIKEVTKAIHAANEDPNVVGIILQRPVLVSDVPASRGLDMMLSKEIDPNKDIDGVVDDSICWNPCVRAMDMLLEEWEYHPSGMHAVILGRGEVGSQIEKYLLSRNATVTVCHSKTPDYTRVRLLNVADIIVGAAGLKIPTMPTTWNWNRIVIDYGITMGGDGKLHGDISSGHSGWCKYQTSVPGGMGLMVRAALIENIVDILQVRKAKEDVLNSRN